MHPSWCVFSLVACFDQLKMHWVGHKHQDIPSSFYLVAWAPRATDATAVERCRSLSLVTNIDVPLGQTTDTLRGTLTGAQPPARWRSFSDCHARGRWQVRARGTATVPEVPTLVSAPDALSVRGADVATRLPGANFLRGRRGADVATRLPGANLSRGSVGVCPAPMCAAQVGGTHRPGTVSSRDKIGRD